MNSNNFYKNLTTRQVTLLITASVAITVSIMYFAFSYLDVSPLIKFLIFFVSCYIICFIILKLLLEKYIFRKLKLIYKIIYDSKKDPKGGDVINFSQKSLLDVNESVVEWANSTKKEIASLKTLEEYRKNYVGNISHELKTPIFTIQAYLHTLLDGGLQDENINVKYLSRAADNVERLQNIVEDLEVISNLESGQVQMDMRKFELKELVNDIFMDIKPMAQEKKVKLQFKEGAAQPFSVIGDRESIRQVLINLLVNSIKYGQENGTTKVSFYDMDTVVLIEISDNGIGIGKKHLKHLFDRFYRVDKSRSRNQGGSGLGLSIVKHIIEAHGQTINVRSKQDVGTTFGFTLQKSGR